MPGPSVERVARRAVRIRSSAAIRNPLASRALLCSALVLLALLAYWGHWRGDFVYDDVYQIQGNGLLRSPAGVLEAMGKDVWAFKGDRAEAWSNYWRPGFVAWLALNYRLFGVESPVGWHWTSWLLLVAGTVLAFRLLERAGLPRGAAFAAAAIFAVHPVHVESVGWISGSPDPLVACWLLGCLLLLPDEGRPRLEGRWVVALALYALALLTKEIAVLGALLVAALDGSRPRRGWTPSDRLLRAAPFAALAALFVALRGLVLGGHELDLPWRLDLADRLLSLPRVLGFYLGQTVLPWRLSPGYPLRTMRAAEASLGDWLALAAVVALAAGALLLALRRPVLRLPLALASVPLLPALNVAAFHPEQIVHDRYLYLPILGAAAAAAWAGSRLRERLRPATAPALAAVTAIAVTLLAVQTQRYLPVWQNARALWGRAVEIDPGSAFAQALYGKALSAGGDLEGAAAAFDRSLEIFASPLAYTARGELRMERGNLEGARRDLEKVVAAQPTNTAAVERLALVLQRGGALDDAEQVLRGARSRIPHYRCALTTGLGVVLYLQGRKMEALAELESNRGRATSSSPANCQIGLFHLATLYAELGRTADARSTYEAFLGVTGGSPDSTVASLQREARRALGAR